MRELASCLRAPLELLPKTPQKLYKMLLPPSKKPYKPLRQNSSDCDIGVIVQLARCPQKLHQQLHQKSALAAAQSHSCEKLDNTNCLYASAE
jgi:hypothetical protein